MTRICRITITPEDERLRVELEILPIVIQPIREHPTGHQDKTDVLVPPGRCVPSFPEIRIGMLHPSDKITGLEGGLAPPFPTIRWLSDWPR